MGMSIRERAVLGLLGVLLVALWMILILPERERTQRATRDLAQLESQIRSSGTAMAALTNTEREIRDGRERIQKLQESILGAKDLRRILTLITRETHELGIKVVSVRPLEERPTSGEIPTRQLPIELELQGRFLDLGRYLEGLQTGPVLLTLEGVQLMRVDKGSRLALRVVAVVHVRPQGP
jgi:Tfp pilus assembly protein PilO